MASSDMVDFQSALSQLQMSEGDLQNLIASGELKAFRSGGMMKFRKSDIDNLRRDKSTEPTIIIPAAGSGTNYDVPTDLGIDESAATVIPDSSPGGAAPTVELDGGSGGMPKGGGTEEILFEDSELEIMPVESRSSGQAAASSGSSRRGRSGSRRMAPAADEYEDADEDEAPSPGASGRRSRAGSARAEGSPLMAMALVATTLVFIMVGSIFGVVLWKGYYSEEKQSVYVPGFLKGLQEGFKDVGNP